MDTKFKNELIKLQTELSTLEKAVKHISQAEKAATDAVKSSKDFTDKYQKSLTEITKSYEKIGTTYKDQQASSEKFLASYSLLSAKTENLLKELKSSDLPTQLAKVTEQQTQLFNEVKNTQLLVDANESTVKAELAKITAEITKPIKPNSLITGLLVVSILMGVAAIALQFIK